MYVPELVLEHDFIIKSTSKKLTYDKIIHFLKEKEHIAFPINEPGKYVWFILKESNDRIKLYYFENRRFGRFNKPSIISAILDVQLYEEQTDVQVNIKISTEPTPAKYTTLVREEDKIEFDMDQIKIYWVDIIHNMRAYFRIEYTKETLDQLYPMNELIKRHNEIKNTRKKMVQFTRNLSLSFQFAMIFPLALTFGFVYYDRGVYEWAVIWAFLMIGPVLFIMLYPLILFKLKTEEAFVNKIISYHRKFV